MNAATYAATEHLRNGAALHIRALRPPDRAEMLAAFGRLGKEAVYRRFFGPKRGFSESEIHYFLDVDFVAHVALAAVLSEGGRETIQTDLDTLATQIATLRPPVTSRGSFARRDAR